MTPRQQIVDRGFYVARGLLEREEAVTLRAMLRDHFRRAGVPFGLGLHQPDAGQALPALAALFSNTKILETLSELAGHEDVTFTGNCDAHKNVLNGVHRDFLPNPTEVSLSEKPQLFRVGVYLQDHDTDRRGLHVLPGSHHTQVSDRPNLHIPTRTGDVTFHDVRLVHSGTTPDRVEKILKRMQSYRVPKGALAAIHNRWVRLSGRPDKFALFFTYGIPGPQTEAFCANERRRRICRQQG